MSVEDKETMERNAKHHNYHKEVIRQINGYVDGKINKKEASDWALEAIISKDFEDLPEKVREGIHMLFDLHDDEADWVPSKDEFLKYKEDLEKSVITTRKAAANLVEEVLDGHLSVEQAREKWPASGIDSVVDNVFCLLDHWRDDDDIRCKHTGYAEWQEGDFREMIQDLRSEPPAGK